MDTVIETFYKIAYGKFNSIESNTLRIIIFIGLVDSQHTRKKALIILLFHHLLILWQVLF
jgi:hypothetical protein